MSIKVKVNLPDNVEELYKKAADTIAEILIVKLSKEEVEQFVTLLRKDNFTANL